MVLERCCCATLQVGRLLRASAALAVAFTFSVSQDPCIGSLHSVKLLRDKQRAANTTTAYACCSAAALLSGCAGIAAAAQNLVLLAALAAALAPGGAALSAVLLTVGSIDWLPGIVLQGVSSGLPGRATVTCGVVSICIDGTTPFCADSPCPAVCGRQSSWETV
jgi:hypothetical protein